MEPWSQEDPWPDEPLPPLEVVDDDEPPLLWLDDPWPDEPLPHLGRAGVGTSSASEESAGEEWWQKVAARADTVWAWDEDIRHKSGSRPKAKAAATPKQKKQTVNMGFATGSIEKALTEMHSAKPATPSVYSKSATDPTALKMKLEKGRPGNHHKNNLSQCSN